MVEVEGETVSFFCSDPWSFFQLLESDFNSIPVVPCVSKHYALEGDVCDENGRSGSRAWRSIEDLIVEVGPLPEFHGVYKIEYSGRIKRWNKRIRKVHLKYD